MKYVIVIPDGAADEPLSELDGRTPLEAAQTPNMDRIALSGRQGRIVTVPEGFTAGTDVATLSLFGYDPSVYYSGRAPLEAAAQGLTATDDQLIFRSNFVTIEDGLMKDFTADHISQAETEELIAALNVLFADEPCTFHAGVSYRNLMLASRATDMRLTCQPPHDIPNQPIADYQPTGTGNERIRSLMARAANMLADHSVNKARIASGKGPANHIWLWGQGKPTILEPFAKRYGPSGAVITGVDILRGLAVCMGMTLIDVPGATGYLDTDYAGKGRAAVEALRSYDLVVVHVEAPDEAAHQGNLGAKITAIERVDEYVVGPLHQALRQYDYWRMLIAPDHPTPVTSRSHSAVPPPFCYAGSDIQPAQKMKFSEKNAETSGLFIDPGYTLIEQFIGP